MAATEIATNNKLNPTPSPIALALDGDDLFIGIKFETHSLLFVS